jgi:protein-tyrosine-phosphatase
MAEILLQSLGGKEFVVHSAGLEPEAVHPLAIKVMQEVGMPVTEKTVKHIDHYEEIQGASKNSIKAMMARRNRAKKRSLHGVNEHFEPGCNAASAPSVNF